MAKRQLREGLHPDSGQIRKSQKTHHHKDHEHSPNETWNKDHQHTQKEPLKSEKDETAQLDIKHPSKTSYAHVPHYEASKPLPISASQLPPLPPISDSLSEAPFTHGSVVDAKYGSGNSLTYERLEFLGDAYLEIIATRLIYARFPQLITGRQAHLREKLVKNSTLASFARAYGFGDRVRMDASARAKFSGERPGDKSVWEKVLADVFEAYVAAVVLSDDQSGFATAEGWLTSLWVNILLETEQDATLDAVQNRKEELVKLIGGRDVKLEYVQDKPMELTPDKSRQQYFAALYLTGWGYEKKRIGAGVGTGRKEAGMKAAADALDNNREFLDEIAEVKRKFDAERKERMERERREVTTAVPGLLAAP